MSTVIFAGPTIYPRPASVGPAVSILPPAGKGDLLRAAENGAHAIGLIDGVFENAPSVWHKEILYCIDRGISVLGSASMGALRAAECARFGMIGIGQIFQDYASGRRLSDADVAILHAPAALGYKPLSVALVDVDAVLDRKHNMGRATENECEALRALAGQMHFKERTWKRIFQHSGIEPARILEVFGSLDDVCYSQKRVDGYKLISLLASASSNLDSEKRPVFEFQNSYFFSNLRNSMHQRRDRQ